MSHAARCAAPRTVILASLAASPSSASRPDEPKKVTPITRVDVVDVMRLRAVTGCDERSIRTFLKARIAGEKPNVKAVTERRIEAGAKELGIVLPPEVG